MIPILVFLQEASLFGDRKPNYTEFIKHQEMYLAIGSVIEATHITGLQRVNGMWRIYIDNLEDKATLIASWVTLRGKNLPILRTNPLRYDNENVTRVRVQNIPLSADDGFITRAFVLKGIDVISIMREKLRINSKLTNCETGDRLINVKTITLKEPLERFMQIGQFKAKIIHKGQAKKTLKCGKCLETVTLQLHVKTRGSAQIALNRDTKKGDCPLGKDATDTSTDDCPDSSVETG